MVSIISLIFNTIAIIFVLALVTGIIVALVFAVKQERSGPSSFSWLQKTQKNNQCETKDLDDFSCFSVKGPISPDIAERQRWGED